MASGGGISPPLVDSLKCPRCSLVGICLPDEVQFLKQTELSPRPFGSNIAAASLKLQIGQQIGQQVAARPLRASRHPSAIGRVYNKINAPELLNSLLNFQVGERGLCAFARWSLTRYAMRRRSFVATVDPADIRACWLTPVRGSSWNCSVTIR